MIKYKILFLIFAAVFLMTSCSKHDVTPNLPSTAVPAESEYTESATDSPEDPELTVPPTNGLAALSDYDLFEAVHLQMCDLVYRYPSESAALEAMTQAQRVFYVLSMYDMEMQNGGLCQFFVNTSSSLVSDVEYCLEILGADAHRDLFVEFMETNQIDASVLESFVIFDLEDYIAQTKRYDFHSFDMSYYDLPPLFDDLVEYVRSNIDEF